MSLRTRQIEFQFDTETHQTQWDVTTTLSCDFHIIQHKSQVNVQQFNSWFYISLFTFYISFLLYNDNITPNLVHCPLRRKWSGGLEQFVALRHCCVLLSPNTKLYSSINVQILTLEHTENFISLFSSKMKEMSGIFPAFEPVKLRKVYMIFIDQWLFQYSISHVIKTDNSKENKYELYREMPLDVSIWTINQMKVTNIFVPRMSQVFLAVILLVVFIPFASQTGEINQHNSDCVTVMRQRDSQARKFQ